MWYLVGAVGYGLEASLLFASRTVGPIGGMLLLFATLLAGAVVGMASKRWDLPALFSKCLLPAWCGAAIIAWLTLVGVLASLFTQEIVHSASWWQNPWTLGVAFLAGVIPLFLREEGLEEVRRKESADLRKQAADFRTMLETYPPQDFLKEFRQAFGQGFSMVVRTTTTERPTDDLVQDVRTILFLIATLAQYFERNQLGTVYAANLMLFRPRRSMPGEEQTARFNAVMFNQLPLDDLLGFLDLHVTFSATTSSPTPDPEFSSFSLAVPSRLRGSDGRYLALPGAPKAFIDSESRLHGFSDTRDVEKWCREYGAYGERIVQELRHYFTSHEGAMRSFVSIELPLPDPAGSTSSPIGVLNIHCNRPGFLNQRVVELLLPVLSTFTPMIVHLLVLLRDRHAVAFDSETAA